MAGTITPGLVETVSERTAQYPFKIWGFGEGPALLALLQAGERLGRPELIDHVADLIQPFLAEGSAPTDHLIAVEVLVKLAQLRPSLDVGPPIARFTRSILGAPRPTPGAPAVHRPDLPHLCNTVWVDCMHTDIPGLRIAGLPEESRSAAREYCAAMQDSSALFSHGFDAAANRPNGVHWGRGQGWALFGLVGAPSDPVLGRSLSALFDALAAHEEEGRWRTVVDDRAAPLENSVSAFVAGASLEASKYGLASPATTAMGRRALGAAIAAIDSEGGLAVSGATPVGDHQDYLNQPTGVFPWGQGPLLLALLEEESRHGS